MTHIFLEKENAVITFNTEPQKTDRLVSRFISAKLSHKVATDMR